MSVTEAEPNCGCNASNGSVIVGDHLRMWCIVKYWGNIDPAMEWSKNDGTVGSTVIYNKDIFFSTATSTSYQTMNLTEHNVVYICNTYFKKPIVDSQNKGSSSASNAPDYKDECKVTVNVLCKLYI